MHQILGLRPWQDSKTGKWVKIDKFFEKGWAAPNIAALLDNPEKFISKVPKKERFNIFYTTAECSHKKRELKVQKIIPFDVDGMDISRKEEYIDIICTILEVDKTEIGIICSGNGLHFLIGLDEKLWIKDKNFFKENRAHYKTILRRLNQALNEKNLPGELDPQIWAPGQLLRYPGTENRKPGKKSVYSYVINANVKRLNFDISKISGIADTDKKDYLSKKIMKQYKVIDESAVLNDCPFLKHCKDNPEKVSEPQWYAALSVVARFEDGYNKAHKFSQHHPGYTKEETDIKIEQALESSGPRTCKSISGLFPGCIKCPYLKKESSPITITGPDHIATANTGFYEIIVDEKDNKKMYPAYNDLRKYFDKKHPYRGLLGSKMVYVYNGAHYEFYETTYIEEFARKHFDPEPNNNIVTEFRHRVTQTKTGRHDFWEDSIKGKMNFSNGVLDLKTMKLSSHSKKYGFRYKLPYGFDESAKAPVFESMLNKITGQDEKLNELILEFMGYALSNDECWTQKCLVLVGSGANGKSTFIDVLKALVGPDSYSAISMDDLNKNEYNRQSLDGKLFNISEETPTRGLANSSLFKNLVTGGELLVRAPYEKPYTMRNKAKMIFTCNELPKTFDHTHGFYRRLLIVPFMQIFKDTDADYDEHILDKLKDELPGIFNLTMQGYKRLKQRRKFEDLSILKNILTQYKRENDSLFSWFENNVEITNEGEDFAPLNDLYQAYRSDCSDANEMPDTRSKFTRRMKKLIPGGEGKYSRKRLNDSHPWGFVGVKFGQGGKFFSASF